MSRLLVGVMSGTSLDAIDIAIVEIDGEHDDLNVNLLAHGDRPFDGQTRSRLHRASSGQMHIRDAFDLDADLGCLYAEAVLDVLREHHVTRPIDAIGLHGQTVYHNPRRAPAGVTVQLNGAAIVAERLGATVVSNFRSADVAAGGEGAPLVPWCDFLLLRSPELNRIALNIGGIANITWLPRDVSLETLVAFDTGPGNMMIDAAVDYLFGQPIDRNGAIAASAHPDTVWLDDLMRDDYYACPYPKSAGREQFGRERTMEVVNFARARGLEDRTIVATLTALTARSIAHGIALASQGMSVDELIVGGGGVRNVTLMGFLAGELSRVRIRASDEFGLPSDAKEAVCFALLADAHLRGVPANVPSVTGAARQVISGACWPGLTRS